MTRWRASGIHLLLSALLGVCVLALLFFVWYPGPLFRATGGEKLLLLIVGIDVIAGPLLTLLVFNPNKRPHLIKLDLAVIGLVQIAFLVYGLTTMTVARPAYIAFVVDRFVVMPANGLSEEDQAEATDPRYRSAGWTGPELVFVERPVGVEDKEALFYSGLAGKDLEFFPKLYRPYEKHTDAVLARGRNLELLKGQNPVWDEWIAAIEREHGADQVLFLPLKAKLADMAMVIDRESAQPLAYLEVDPWPAILRESADKQEQADEADQTAGEDSAESEPGSGEANDTDRGDSTLSGEEATTD